MNRIRSSLLTIAICAALPAMLPIGALAAQATSRAAVAPAIVHYRGVVVNATAGQLTFRDLRGDYLAAQLTPATRYWVDGRPASRPNFEPGQPVTLNAYREPDDSLVARFVGVYDIEQTLLRFHGRVVGSSLRTLTIRDRAGDFIAVQLMPDTRYVVDGRPSSRPDFQPGQRVFILAHREVDGSLTARVVALTHLDLRRLAGRVIDSSPGSLTFRDINGDVYAIALTGTTRYVVDGQPSSRPQFRFGELVSIVAHQNNDGSLTARLVRVQTNQ